MRDLLPEEAEALRFTEQTAREIARLYGYREVVTPIVENYELLAAKIGEENRKRMYVFEDLGGRKVALRPEFTASVARLVATKMQSTPKPLRLFSVGSLYRYDEPQFGRHREFWQANYEIFGSKRPEADVEILFLTNDFLGKIGLKNYTFKIGHVGILRGILDREKIAEEKQNSIMQLLDKKHWEDATRLVKEASASQECVEDLQSLFEIRGKNLENLVVEIGEIVKPYPEAFEALENLRAIIDLLLKGGADFEIVLEAGFARGLEYYTGLIFEIYVREMAQALGGGGRYDRLIELFGGGKTPAVGIAHGLDRLLLALQKQGNLPKVPVTERVLVIPVRDEMLGEAFKVSSILRSAGICTEVEVAGRSVSRALSDADRKGFTYAVIIGSKEIAEGKVVLRDMERRIQEVIDVDELPARFKA